jgi:hypothetical protein
MPPLRDSLHLREAAIHEQFRYRDVAAVVAGDQHNFSSSLPMESPRVFGPRCDELRIVRLAAQSSAAGRHRLSGGE